MEEGEVLVSVEQVSKKFCKDLKTGLKYGLQDLFSNVFKKGDSSRLRPKEFWAVKDVSFTLRRGECLGLIGHNGAGKSTLLKMLNGLIKPDEGSITMHGRVGALIELGAGFNPILTGRENIYNNGAVLGFSKSEISQKLDAIIQFAELEEFIDMPVQHYSSGMKVRLGFAVAAQMEPDVLIIDEVLAVGDIGFRIKCLTRIGSLLSKTAVIFVSHAMPQIARISNRVLLLNHGKELVNSSNVSAGIDQYYKLFDVADKITGGNGLIRIEEFAILENEKVIDQVADRYLLKHQKQYEFRVKLNVAKNVKQFWVNYSFIDKDTKQVANLFSMVSNEIFTEVGTLWIRVKIDQLILGLGSYTIGIALNEVREDNSRGEIYMFDSNIAAIQIEDVIEGLAPVQFVGDWQIIKETDE